MTALSETCNDLAAWIPVAGALVAEPDIGATTPTRSSATSRPPWNSQAANAYYDIHAGTRASEAQLRMAVSGSVRHRGGSDAATYSAIDAIPKIASAASTALSGDIAQQLSRLLLRVLQLPAVDLEDRPQQIPAPCKYCKRPMLRLYPRDGRITCLAYGSCFDADGRHPVGYLTIGAASSEPFIAWADRSVQFPEGLAL